MSPDIAAIMLSLHTFPPLDSCTYVGLDNGAVPLSVSERGYHYHMYSLTSAAVFEGQLQMAL